MFSAVNIYDIVLSVYKSEGREAAKRMLTPPEKFIRAACKKTGADPVVALKERDEMVHEQLEFLESLVDKNFEDDDD